MQPKSLTRAFLAGALLVLAGCADAPAPKAAQPSGATIAADPVVDADTGSITGTVTDEELLPVAGAVVSLLRTDLTTRADEAGAFTLNQVPPGTYSVFVEALGFESQGRKLDVAPGSVASANFTLKGIALVGAEPYTLSLPRTSFINVDQTWFTYVYHDLAGQNHSQVCGSCIFTLLFPLGGVQFMTEFDYKQTGVPAYNDGVHLSVAAGESWSNHEFCWREQAIWTMEGFSGVGGPMAKQGKAEFAVQSSFAGISFQHRVDMWNTIAYVEPLPEGFTALAPTSEKQQDPSVCVIK